MSKRFVLTGTLCCAMLVVVAAAARYTLAAGPITALDANKPVLGACEGNETLFPTTPEAVVDTWKDRYETRVDGIVNAHLARKNAVNCTELVREPPTDELRALASQLPPWKSNGGTLSENDMAAVLLEHLRVYGCAMKQHLTADLPDIYNGTLDSTMHTNRRGEAEQELVLAPATLERTLQLLSGMDRLRPIDDALQCLSRTSLDIRNTLGLAAETSACLPRIWDAKGSLRSLKP